ncbi:MAG: NADH-quinone oxidoreductase subunit NuoE [Bryobacteraceae bacterium]
MTFSPEMEARLAQMIERYPAGRQRAALIPMLMYAQDEVGSITPEVAEEIARRLDISTLQVDEIVTYYSMLHSKRLGRHHVQICTNVSCMLRGGAELWDRARRRLGIGHKQATADGRISLEEVECIGACSWAPALQVNYEFHHNVTAEQLERLLDRLGGG